MTCLLLLVSALCVMSVLNINAKTLCPPGWDRFVEFCYRLTDKAAADYDGSLAACSQLELDASLPIVRDITVNTFLSGFMTSKQIDKVLLGVKKRRSDIKKQYIWRDQSALNLTAPSWRGDSSAQKTVVGEDRAGDVCANILASGDWELTACTDPQTSLICQKPTLFGRHCGEMVTLD